MKTGPQTWCAFGALFVLMVVCLSQGCSPKGLSPSEAGVLRVAAARIRGFDPVRAADVSTCMAVGKVYEGLMQYDYLARPYRLNPCLSGDFPTVSSNGLVYTFRIRRGIMFHDDPCFTNNQGGGRELVADDFVYSIKRLADVKCEASGYWTLRGRIEGLDDFRAASSTEQPTDYDYTVPGLTAPDRHTLRLVLTRPYPQLLWILAMPYLSAVPREAVEFYGDAFMRHPVGTGPFTLESWRRNYCREYVRNPAWHHRQNRQDDAPDDIPAATGVDRISAYIIDDPSTRWLMFLNGDLDLFTGISRDNWDAVMTPRGELVNSLLEQGIDMQTISGLDIYYIGFNMDDPVVGTNKKLRQAMSCAFNSAIWVRYFNERVQRATGPIPPGVAGTSDQALLPFDLERAKQLLAEAGYPEGLDPATGRRLQLTLELGKTSSDFKESTELLIEFMARLGVVIKPSYNNKPTFFKKIERREAQMFRLSWFADYPDAENFLQLFYSPNSSPGPNRVNYANPTFDKLYEQASMLQDSPARTALYRRMADIVSEDAPWIFMHYPVDYSLSRACLRNYHPHDFPYGMEKYYVVED